MIFTTESLAGNAISTFEVSLDFRGINSIRQTTDFHAVGPLPMTETFLPITFIESPTMGKPCVFAYDKVDDADTEVTITTDPIIHIQF